MKCTWIINENITYDGSHEFWLRKMNAEPMIDFSCLNEFKFDSMLVDSNVAKNFSVVGNNEQLKNLVSNHFLKTYSHYKS
jgi:hypothetical protein